MSRVFGTGCFGRQSAYDINLLTKSFPCSQLGVAPPTKMTQSCGFHPKQAPVEKSQKHQSREYVFGAPLSPGIGQTCHSRSPKRDPSRLPRAGNQLRSPFGNMPTLLTIICNAVALQHRQNFVLLLPSVQNRLVRSDFFCRGERPHLGFSVC